MNWYLGTKFPDPAATIAVLEDIENHEDCMEECLRDDRCVGMNYHVSGTCELKAWMLMIFHDIIST